LLNRISLIITGGLRTCQGVFPLREQIATAAASWPVVTPGNGSRNEARVASWRRATLTDVARLAGVSGTTVSYILNGRADEMRISSQTQQRVREAVDELGYRPNRSARSLRTRTTKTIGVITDFVASGMFASRMLSGANSAARALDHVLVIGETEGDPSVERVLIDEMVERQVDGVLYATRTTVRQPAPEGVPEGRLLMLNCIDPDQLITSVLPDERAGGRTAADAILASGIDDGVYVVGEDPTPNALAGPLRMTGIRERLAEQHVGVSGLVKCEWSVEAAHDAMTSWLAGGHRPRALICLNDRVSMGVYQALAEHQLVVPLDVSVVSFDGSELASWLRPHVTSVALPFEEMGDLAVRLLLDPDRTDSESHLVPMPLVAGMSVATAAPGAPTPVRQSIR
jgi:LacI family transcriptional regulator